MPPYGEVIAIELFKLFGTIMVNNAEANASIDSVEKRAEGAAAKIGKAFDRVEQSVALMGKGITKTGESLLKSVTMPLAALGGAVIALTKSTADYGETVHNASKEVGLSAKAYQELRYALGQAGVAQEQFDLAMSTLNRRIGEARAGNKAMSDSLKRMGIDMKALKNGTVSTEDVFNASIKTLSEMNDGQMQAALAAELFGDRVAKKLLPLIQAGTSDLDALRKRAHELGLVMSDQDAAAAEQFGDTLEDLQFAIGGLFRAFGSKLIPVATQWVEKATASVAGVQSWVRENKHLVAQLVVLGGGVVSIMTVLGLFAGGLILVGQSITALGVILGLLTSQPMLIIAAIGLLYLAWVNNWGGIQDKAEAVWKVIEPILKAVASWTVSAAKTVWEWTVTGLEWVKDTLIPWVKEKLSTAWAWTVTAAGDAYTWLTGTAWPWLSKTASTAWKWTLAVAGDALAWIKDTAWPFINGAASTTWSWAVKGLEWIKETAAAWLSKDKHETSWSWSLLFDEAKLEKISDWFSQPINLPSIPGPDFKAIKDAFTSFVWPDMPKFRWPALPDFGWPMLPSFTWPTLPIFSWPSLPEFHWPVIPTIQWPDIQPPAGLVDAINSVKDVLTDLKNAVAEIQAPEWPKFEIPQPVVTAIEKAGTALSELATAAASAVPPNITDWETFQSIVSKLTSTPLGQFAIKFSSLAKEVWAGEKPISEALEELLHSNLSIPAGAFAIGLLPIPGGWKLALTGVLLALNLLPNVDLSMENLKQIASSVYGKIMRYFGDLGRRFARMQPNEVMAGIQVIDVSPTLAGIEQAGKEIRGAMEAIDIPDGTDIKVEEFARNLGAGISASIAMAIAGVLSNGPALVLALANFMTDIEAGLEHLGKEIGLKIVGPFVGGFIEGLISIPAAIGAAIVEKIREGFKKAGMAAGLSEKDAQAAADKAFKLPDINEAKPGPNPTNSFNVPSAKGKGKGNKVGGYTAQVADDQVAGVVHGNEWVMPAWMVRRYPQLTNLLESMRLRGYRLGGLVGYQSGGGVAGTTQVATVAATVDIKVEKNKLQQAMDSLKGIFANVLDSLPEGAREQVQKAIDFITALIKTVEGSLDTLDLVQQGIEEKASQMKAVMDTKAIDMAKVWEDSLNSMKQKTADILGDMTMSFIKGTFKWQNVLDAFGSAADQIFTQLFSQIALGLLTNSADQVKWLTTTLLNIGTAIAGFLAQAFASLTAFFWFLGPLAPVAAGGVIAVATAAIAKLGIEAGNLVVGAIAGIGGRNNDGGGEASPGRQVSEITGPSRDLLVDLLTPLASLDSLVGVGNRIYDLLDMRLPIMSGQLAVAGAGGITVNFDRESVVVYSSATTGVELTDELVGVLGERLAESMASTGRGQGG